MATLDDFVSFLQGASNSAASNLSAPVDGINWLLGKAGLPVSKAPVGGSDWLRQAGFTAEPKNRNAGLLGEFVGGVMPIVAAAKAPQIAAWLNQAGRNLSAPRTLNPQTGAIVWHGSPHKFEKFSMDKIGTGEGAQAYGHGLYLAEHPATAEVYASKLANGGAMPMPPTPKDFMVDGSRYVRQEGALFKQVGDSADLLPVGKEEYGVSLRKAQQVYEDKLKAGNLYKTDIPDEAVARFLDWDKPLSQQAPEVQAAMAKVIEKKNPLLAQYLKESAGLDEAGQTAVRKRLGINIFDTIDKGGAAYQAAGQGNIEKLMQQQGIPGIRYLDGGSRGAGQGSSNFVVFDPELIRILERNGQATGNIPWQPGEWRGLLGNN